MSNLEKMAATGTEVEIKGKKYIFSPLTIRDMAEFESYIRSNLINGFLTATKDGNIESDERIKILNNLASKEISDLEVSKHMNSWSGGCWLFWKSLNKNHPEIKLEDMGDLIDTESLPEVMAILGMAGEKNKVNSKNPKGRVKVSKK